MPTRNVDTFSMRTLELNEMSLAPWKKRTEGPREQVHGILQNIHNSALMVTARTCDIAMLLPRTFLLRVFPPVTNSP